MQGGFFQEQRRARENNRRLLDATDVELGILSARDEKHRELSTLHLEDQDADDEKTPLIVRDKRELKEKISDAKKKKRVIVNRGFTEREMYLLSNGGLELYSYQSPECNYDDIPSKFFSCFLLTVLFVLMSTKGREETRVFDQFRHQPQLLLNGTSCGTYSNIRGTNSDIYHRTCLFNGTDNLGSIFDAACHSIINEVCAPDYLFVLLLVVTLLRLFLHCTSDSPAERTLQIYYRLKSSSAEVLFELGFNEQLNADELLAFIHKGSQSLEAINFTRLAMKDSAFLAGRSQPMPEVLISTISSYLWLAPPKPGAMAKKKAELDEAPKDFGKPKMEVIPDLL